MTKPKFVLLVIVITILTLFAFSCSTDNSITGNSGRTIAKPQNTYETHTNDLESWFASLSYHYHMPPSLFMWFLSESGITGRMCFFAYLLGIDSGNIDNIIPPEESESTLYNFRDNYLDKSSKGESYIASYYILSKYGIDNNLVNQYYSEHLDLIKESIQIAKNVQSNQTNSILINNTLKDKLDNIIKIYRAHPNHREIDSVLDYLEKDLVKYENQPKSVIVKDF